MELTFHPYALAGIVGFGATWAMAAFLWANARSSSVNEHLAILLLAEGIAVVTSALNFVFLDAGDLYASRILHFMADAAFPPLYLLFLSHALDLPLFRSLRTRAGHVILWALAIAGPILILAFDDQFYAPTLELGPWIPWHFLYVTSAFVLGIVGALIAYRRARTPTAKRRARAFVIAFTFFDLVWGAFYGSIAIGTLQGAAIPYANERALVYALATTIFVSLLSYAILKTQLFDIDLKIKVGIRRGTLALVFLVVFVAVAEIAQTVLSQSYGLAAGGVVAGILLLAIRPLERVADRVAHAAVPNATGSPEYLAFKKLEVYRAAVESAIETDGRIDTREEAKLDRLASKLGVRVEDARAVQRDALAAIP